MTTPGHSQPAAQAASAWPHQLPCGADLDNLLEQVAEGADRKLTQHQQQCTHCRAALAEIERLWSPVVALAAEQLEPPPDLVDKVMSLVRELALEIWHVVVPSDRGVTRIAARVIAAVARRAATRVTGVQVVLGRSSRAEIVADTTKSTQLHQQPGSAVGIAGQRAVIDLAIITDYGVSIPDVAADIRDLVIRDLSVDAGLHEVQINIFIDDVFEPTPLVENTSS